MADAVATQVLYESGVRYVAKFTNVSDGTGESAVAKITVASLTPAAIEVDIMRIIYATDGMAVRILFDASTDDVAWVVPSSQHGVYDFTEVMPGFVRNPKSSGYTGNILFTTFGHTLGDSYSIILDCKKRITGES